MAADATNKTFDLETTETVRRHYRVLGRDEKDAKKWLHLHWQSPEMLRDGVVTATGVEEVANRQVSKVTELRSRAEGMTPTPRTPAEPRGSS